MLHGRTPTKAEKEWLDKSCQLGCIICLEWYGVISPCCPHHITGKTKSGAHFKTIPLCDKHHQIADTNKPKRWFSLHGDGKKQFTKAYASEQELLDMVKLHVERCL